MTPKAPKTHPMDPHVARVLRRLMRGPPDGSSSSGSSWTVATALRLRPEAFSTSGEPAALDDAAD